MYVTKKTTFFTISFVDQKLWMRTQSFHEVTLVLCGQTAFFLGWARYRIKVAPRYMHLVVSPSILL